MPEEYEAIQELMEGARRLLDETAPPVEEPASQEHRPNRNPGGAPTGNQNARKHGLYSRLLPPEGREEAAEEIPTKSLKPEIQAVRERIAERMADPNTKLEDLLPALRVLGQMVSVNQKFQTFHPRWQ